MTATEVYTSSTLLTPSPSWTTYTVSQTIQPPPAPKVKAEPDYRVHLPSAWPKITRARPVDPLTGLEHADVLEIGRSTSPAEAKTNLDRLKQAYDEAHPRAK